MKSELTNVFLPILSRPALKNTIDNLIALKNSAVIFGDYVSILKQLDNLNDIYMYFSLQDPEIYM